MLVIWSQFDDISTTLRFTIIAFNIWLDYPIQGDFHAIIVDIIIHFNVYLS